MKTKALVAAVMVVAAGVGGYWHFSPYLALNAMRDAAQSNDADAFNEKVDYPKMRESLKGQMSAVMAKEMGSLDGNGFAAVGAMLGMAMVNQMVDSFVRPEVVMSAMQNGKFKPEPGEAGASKDSKQVEWSLDRKGSNKVIAYSKEPGQAQADDDVGLVFERYGFADWKLTEIRLHKLK